MFAGLGGGEHGVQVQGVGGQHQHQVHLGVIDHLPPVVGDEIAPVLVGRRLQAVLAAGTQRHDPRLVGAFADLGAVGRADEPGGSDDADSECHGVGFLVRGGKMRGGCLPRLWAVGYQVQCP